MDWTIGRAGTYRFFRVAYATRLEVGELTTIRPGGTLARNVDSDLKESGSLVIVDPPALGDDLVRIYYNATDANGAQETVVLATMHAKKPTAAYTSAAEVAQVELVSALQTLQEAKLRYSLTLPAGSVAVAVAVDICEDIGLPVMASASSKELTADAGFEAGDSLLKVVNWLLDYADFWSARPDPWGRVVMAPYSAPSERQSVWNFLAGPFCIFRPAVTIDTDAFDVPNVCVLTCSNLDTVISGSYTNADPASPYSTVNRGREITLAETVDDAVDQADLIARAKRRLEGISASTDIITLEHAYVPVTTGDVVRYSWPRHGHVMRASVQSQDITLTPACMIRETMRRIWS